MGEKGISDGRFPGGWSLGNGGLTGTSCNLEVADIVIDWSEWKIIPNQKISIFFPHATFLYQTHHVTVINYCF